MHKFDQYDYDEFVKISIHNHLGGRKADLKYGDQIETLEFDSEQAHSEIEELRDHKFNLIAVTNSNYIWADDFHSICAKYVDEDDINILPGIELNIVNRVDKTSNDDSYRILHMVIILNPNCDLKEFNSKIENYYKMNKEIIVDTNQLAQLLLDYESVVIPHGIKDRGLPENPEILEDILTISKSVPMSIEGYQEYHKETLLKRIQHLLTKYGEKYVEETTIVSSLDRTPIKQLASPTYIWGPNSFESLFYACLLNNLRFFRSSNINRKNNYVSGIEIKNNGGVLQDCSLTFSHGLNAIIGPSGSGKTMLLNLLSEKITGMSLEESDSSINHNYDQMYTDSEINLIDKFGDPIEPGDFDTYVGENLYDKIIKAYSSNREDLLDVFDNATIDCNKFNELILKFDDEVKQYVDKNILLNELYAKTIKSIDKVHSLLDYLELNRYSNDAIEFEIDQKLVQKISTINKKIMKCTKDIETVQKSFRNLESVIEDYDENLLSELHAIKSKIKSKLSQYLNDFKVNSARLNNKKIIQNIIYSAVEKYNEKIGSVNKIVMERKQSAKNIIHNEIIENLKNYYVTRVSYRVPYLDADKLKKSLELRNKYGLFIDEIQVKPIIRYSDDTLVCYFSNSIGPGKKRLNKTEFKNLKDDSLDLSNSIDVKKLLDIFVEKEFKNNSFFNPDIEDILSYKLYIKDDNDCKRVEDLSAGELSKIYVSKMIDIRLEELGNNVIILYDQPDSKLEKRFILNNLVDKLTELKKQYQIFITTHEPLLVVNGDANCIIKANHKKIAASESEITYSKLNILDAKSKSKAVNNLSEIIDGNASAVKLRSDIYGGMINEN